MPERSSRAITRHLPLLALLSILASCDAPPILEQGANKQGHTAPTAVTVNANKAVLDKRPFDNRTDFDNATRGLIAQSEHLAIKHNNGSVLWDMTAYDFIADDGNNPPASVNPSLWRQAALNKIHGLFRVTEGIYQVRGYDLSNMSIIEGRNGWILVDPLTTYETAYQALAFAQQHLGKHPITAVLLTHSHIDHFGGMLGILAHLSEEEKANLKIIAPEGFTQEATSENILIGTAMGRRAGYMYGASLARNERGHVDNGLGKATPFGTFGFAMPNLIINQENLNQTIDGVPFIFQMVSGSEAPAEFTFYLPEHKAFCGAELVSHNMHNLYTLRGAKVRDALLWSGFIDEAREKFATADVYFASHHWPIWQQDNINNFLIKQRDTYKFIHDQTVRLLNQGYTPNEIADVLTLPEALNQDFHNQGYYGTIEHNAKAVYQGYQGWFTGNPAKLHPLPEPEAATRYIKMMGGIDQVMENASQQFEDAAKENTSDGIKTYRWLAELLNHAVFAEPDNNEAKALLAKIYDQLGYQAESGSWRNFYLTGAYELRHGVPKTGILPSVMREVLMETNVVEFFRSMAANLVAEKADGVVLSVKVAFSDLDESYLLTIKNSVMHYKKASADTEADASLTLTRPMFVDILIGNAGLKETLFSDDLTVDGSKLDLIKFFSMLGKPTGLHPIVTP